MWLTAVFAALALVLVARLFWWMLLSPGIDAGGNPQMASTIAAARGSILDAQGQYLVASTLEYKVGLTPRLLSDAQKERLAPEFARILDMPLGKVNEVLAQNDVEYAILHLKAPAAAGLEIEAMRLDALKLEITYRRVYADASLAACLLGFYHYDGRGQYGLEQYYDKALRGVDGVWRGVTDMLGEQISVSLGGYQSVRNGVDLVLTIDRNIQFEAERILAEGARANKASSGNMVVLDPKTGAVLAMANYPAYQPARYWDVASPTQYINSSISSIYEPGSVFKPLTLAAGLEAKVIVPESTYDDRGEIIVGNQRILNSDKRAHGTTTMTQLLAYSRNVGAAHVATMLGPTRFYELIRRFGFSELTGIDLALEASGIMRVPGNSYWHMSDLGTNSFGQGISATPIQVVAAYAALANKGVLMRPYVVREMRGIDGVEVHEPFVVRQVVSREVAQQTTRLMVDAVEMGMEKARVPGYLFAGKSGTSGIADQEGYETENIIASFAGFGPMPDPRFVILCKYDKPTEGYWGIDVAAPEFAQMAAYLCDYYGIPPTKGRGSAH